MTGIVVVVLVVRRKYSLYVAYYLATWCRFVPSNPELKMDTFALMMIVISGT